MENSLKLCKFLQKFNLLQGFSSPFAKKYCVIFYELNEIDRKNYLKRPDSSHIDIIILFISAKFVKCVSKI